jgi:hypothetical protein
MRRFLHQGRQEIKENPLGGTSQHLSSSDAEIIHREIKRSKRTFYGDIATPFLERCGDHSQGDQEIKENLFTETSQRLSLAMRRSFTQGGQEIKENPP